MIKILSGIFIKNKGEDERRAYGLLCSALGIVLNILLFAVKFAAGSISGAISVTADAFNNLADSGSSCITLLGFKLASKKPDLNHPFGHGRIEYLSGIAVSVLIILMGFELITDSVKKILHPSAPEISAVVFAVLAASVLVKLYIFAYNRKYGRKYSSGAMLATSVDSLSDAVSTSAVFVSMLITCFTDINTDAYCGAAVAAFILFAGVKSAYETVQPLLGQPPEEEFVKNVESIALSGKYVLGLHDLVVHDYGPGRCMLSLHAEVPADEDIFALHDSIDNIEKEISDKLGCSAVIHMDPIQNSSESLTKLREVVKQVCEETDEIISFHDFRAVEGDTHTNLIFDVVVSPDCKTSDLNLKRKIQEKVQSVSPDYYTVVTVDKSYAPADGRKRSARK